MWLMTFIYYNLYFILMCILLWNKSSISSDSNLAKNTLDNILKSVQQDGTRSAFLFLWDPDLKQSHENFL